MLTSESNNREFHKFFDEHRNELAKRLAGLLVKKHRRAINALLKKGAEIPPIWGTLKLPETTIYTLPIGIKPAKVNFQVTSFVSFMIIKDLREQTPIIVTDSQPHVIMYSAHAVRRYRERMSLDSEMEFLEVCKHMSLNGCCSPRIIGDMSKIYGSRENRGQVSLISLDGAYMGFADGNTEVYHAETFLSANELRHDQRYLDASKSEDLALWKAAHEAYSRGEITWMELRKQSVGFTNNIAISEGRIVKLNPEEAKLRDEENKKMIESSEYIEQSKKENREKFNKKVQRKGYM